MDVVMLGDSLVSSPMEIAECTNFVGPEFNVIREAGTVNELEPITYMIGDDLLTIPLPAVEFFCTHSPY